MRYLTVEQIKAYCRNELPTEDDEWFEAAGDAAEAALDQHCQRRFAIAGATATPLVFDTPNFPILRFPDCVAVTSIGTLSAASYRLEPLNGQLITGEAVPYTQARLKRDAWGAWGVWSPDETLTVTARWGWSAIPARIEQAALIIAKEIITNRDEVKLGLIGFSDVGGVVARTNPIVRETVAHYRRVESWGVA